MKTRSPLFLIAALSLLLSGCATSPSTKKLPEWVLNPGAKYSSMRYMTAVGEGDTLRSAESHALNRLAGRFKTRIQSNARVSDNTAETFGENPTFEKTSAYLSDIQLETDETLLNVETLEHYRNAKGRVFVLAALNRIETAQLYADKIAQHAQRIQSLADAEPYKLKEYAKARQALILGLKNQQLLDQLSVIHSDSAEMMNLPYQIDTLRTRAAQAAHSIRFHVQMQDKQSVPFGRQISAVMTQRGFTENATSDLIISGSITIQDLDFLRKDIHTVRYHLELNITDPSGKTVMTLQKEGRESRLSRAEALRHATRTVNEQISQELNTRLNALLNHLAGGES